MILAAATGPTPFWYATRGSGYTALVLLSATVVLGLMTSARWHAPRWPRFLSQSLHRNLSLLVVVFVVIHVATSIIDPFAGLSLRDAVVPAGASYRPLWLGLGVVALELLVAIVVTSLVRSRLPWRAWQLVHLLTYISWPVAVLHSIGTGTDTKAVWALLLVVVCVLAVAISLVWRLSIGWPRQAAPRALGIGASLAAVIALTAWTASGPLQPGWARAAGTPANLLASGSQASSSAPSPAPAPGLAAGLQDQLSGRLQSGQTTTTALLQDDQDPSLAITIVVQASGSASLTITRSGATLCNSSATVGSGVDAQCGAVVVHIDVFQRGPAALSGTLTTRPAGG